ncbi:MAG: sulfatase-like hydrolase/transferase [Armatimonadota bacterium]
MHSLDRRRFLKRTGALATAAALAPLATQERETMAQRSTEAPRKRPNVLILFSDDQRFDTIHALGNEHIITPNLDALVRGGVAFTHAHIMGSMQGAVCVPSRAMLLTGRTLFRCQPLEEGMTFPEVFRADGYTTFATGKWHNGAPAFARGFSAGADIFMGGMNDHWRTPVHDFDPTGKYPKESRRTGEAFSSELFSNAAIKFLREYDGDDPFLMYVSYTAPHDPRIAPQKYADMYDPDEIPLPPNFMPEHPFDNGEMKIRDEKLAPWPRTPEIVRQHLADYYAMITHMDEHIGHVLAALHQTGRADDTIVVFAGDNGLAVGQHGLLGKQNLYEHSVRVPLVVCGPGIPEGRRSRALVYLYDIFPTICELTGVAAPDTVEGESLVPLIKRRKRRLRDSVFAAYKDIQRMVRDERYKLIEYRVNGTRTTQLFDVANDPWELSNLSADPKHGKRLAQLREEMTRWQRDVGDPAVDEWPR